MLDDFEPANFQEHLTDRSDSHAPPRSRIVGLMDIYPQDFYLRDIVHQILSSDFYFRQITNRHLHDIFLPFFTRE